MPAWLPIAIRYANLLIKYGPSIYALGVEVYRIIAKLRAEGQHEVADARALALEYELAHYASTPRRLRCKAGLKNVRAAARREAGIC